MVFTRLHRRWTAWLALCAILMGALAPTVSHAMRAWSHSPISWVEVCSSTGNKLIAMTTSDRADPSGGLPSGEHAGEHCPFCLVHAHDAAMLPATPAVMALSTPITDELPFLFLHAPRSLFAWAPSQARAPPTSV
ncbi:DUF2946 domain-containing protein [Aquabacterium sp.]|uniref:DUF2946 domain-containing protein n=1 Tax=Aquabacterium sp. TaxID=1872578 RepID=UPI002488600E|nr:DUF2946 domain-containing protein [Aquabacterium sp.]MDI1259926.1 DUF2946 domain-containing protein [Aquabacterium sp.]